MTVDSGRLNKTFQRLVDDSPKDVIEDLGLVSTSYQQLERAIEALYVCARQYGKDLNLELSAKYLEETRGKDILIEWNYLGNPENPDPDDTLVATFFLEDLVK